MKRIQARSGARQPPSLGPSRCLARRAERPRMLLQHRFNGPKDSANGGYTCGRLSAELPDECVEVTLRVPPPLDREMQVKHNEGVVELYDGETLVAQARASELELELPEFPTWDEALEATKNYAGHEEHPFSTCFVCGPDRAPEDGLNVFAGPVAGTDLVAAPWIPAESLGDDQGLVKSEFLWCALDCPGAFAVDQNMETPMVLGRFTAQVFSRPKVGEEIRVVGWPLGTERRKSFAGTALIDSEGRVCAAARAVWISLA